MKFCVLEIATMDIDIIQMHYTKLYQLTVDAICGDIFENYILLNQPTVNEYMHINKGDYVNLFPIKFIYKIRTNRDDLQLDDFTMKEGHGLGEYYYIKNR